MAMDRDFKNVKSVSPLKHRVDLDVEPSPSRLVMLETLRQSSPYRSRSRGKQTSATLPLSLQQENTQAKSPLRDNPMRSSSHNYQKSTIVKTP
jgi:Ca2+-binding EF-hand superfamily protein